MSPLSHVVEDRELKTCRDHYRKLQKIWVSSDFEEELKELLRHPFARIFPLSKILASLLCPEKDDSFDLSVKEVQASYTLHKMLSIAELCQLALFKVVKGEKKSAETWIQEIGALLKFSTLWTTEDAYDPLEFYLSTHLLYSYMGCPKMAALCKMASFGAKNPFFTRLEMALSFAEKEKNVPSSDLLPSLGTWVHGGFLTTLSGCGTSLSIFQQEDVEIRAAGPQFYPLTDSRQFGIRGIHEASVLDKDRLAGWTCCFAEPQVWLHVEAFSQGRLHVRFQGLTAEKKGAFVFYVKAKTAHVGRQIFLSKSLQRYKGVAQEVRFNEEALVIACREPRSVELIPLSGENGFWNADFLVAFEMFPFDSEEWFSFKTPSRGLL